MPTVTLCDGTIIRGWTPLASVACDSELRRAVTTDHDAIRDVGADPVEVQRLLDARARRPQTRRRRQSLPFQRLATPRSFRPAAPVLTAAGAFGALDGATQPHNPFVSQTLPRPPPRSHRLSSWPLRFPALHTSPTAQSARRTRSTTSRWTRRRHAHRIAGNVLHRRRAAPPALGERPTQPPQLRALAPTSSLLPLGTRAPCFVC